VVDTETEELVVLLPVAKDEVVDRALTTRETVEQTVAVKDAAIDAL
jgi:hypothetical protein